MAYEDLEKIEKLVHHLWDAAALICLERRPLRYTELHRDMRAWSGHHLSESELTRTRHRLVRRRMITVEQSGSGHNVYSITEAGRVRLNQIRILAQIAPSLDEPNDGVNPDDDEKHTDSEKPDEDENAAEGEERRTKSPTPRADPATR